MVRRSTFDPFAIGQNRRPHNVRVINQYGKTETERQIPAGADLRAEFYIELVRMAQQGWTLEESFKGSCLISRGTDRWLVSLSESRD